MTILSVVQNVCLAVGIEYPDAVFSSDDRTMREMQRVVNDVAASIRDVEFDWQALQAIYLVTGDGAAGAFNLPSDYARMTTKGSLWSSRWSWGINKIASLDEWIEMQATPYVSVTGDWIIFGDQLHVMPIMAATETIRFPYVRNTIVRQAGGARATAFTADTDTFVLSERLLELGIIAKWKAQKGVPSEDLQEDFDKALYTAMNNDKGSKPIVSGNNRRFSDVKTAFPFKVNP
ncbi:hypothetical protein [Agrobacterium cavarae]|uniref:hypothetical protein n=1 Tax=Agrobacterium cavarae TaxID=2528239 RepID=UPI0028A0CF1F|nr:hypothetical protein [Agrobacterium cavarae]